MLNLQKAMNEMMIRVAKREANAKVRPLEKKIKELNLAGRQMKKLIDKQQKEILTLSKNIAPNEKIQPLPPEAFEKARLSPKLIAMLRKKLKLSRQSFAKLLGVASNTIFMWESGRSKPRQAYKAKIISLRSLGKRQIREMLKESKPQA
ncbi:MAG: helix-turn-helix domain-containing protein [Victivallales bacterium]|jgi:DNA-binding transcriptional regulator YiaG